MIYKKVVEVDDIQKKVEVEKNTRIQQKQMICKKVVEVDDIQESSRSR